MKKLIAIVGVIFSMFLGNINVLFVNAEDTNAAVSTDYSNDDGYYTGTLESNMYVNSDGTYTCVQYNGTSLVYAVYNSAYVLQSKNAIALELPKYGGFYHGKDYNYLVVGHDNLNESDSQEVVRVIKYSFDWKRIGSCSIYGANTYQPFEAGSVRFTESGNHLIFRTCHTMYKDSQNLHHQANMTYELNTSTMTMENQYHKVMNYSIGYVSHSFDQFVQTDGDKLVAVDLGDAHPRAVAIFRYQKTINETGLLSSDCDYAMPINITGTYGDNYTGATIGGFEVTTNNYLIVGSYANKSTNISEGSSHAQNLFVSVTNKTTMKSTVKYLTDFADDSKMIVKKPQLVKVATDKYLMMWREYNWNDYTQSDIKYVFLDGDGNTLGDVQTSKGTLSSCHPVVVNGQVLWFYTENKQIKFCQIGVDGKLTQMPASISMESSLTVKTGKTLNLQNHVQPDNAVNKDVTYSIANPSIATVDQSTVTGVKKGRTTITARTANNKTATAVLVDDDIYVNKIDFAEINLKIGLTGSLQVHTYIYPSDATDKTLTYTSSDPSIASVSSTGVVTALKEGKVTITAHAVGGATGTVDVTCTETKVTSVDISKTEMQITTGSEEYLSANTVPYYATFRTLTWTSSDESVAVYQDGYVKGLKEGTAVITATAKNGMKASCTVTVKDILPTNISINYSAMYTSIGKTQKIYAYISPYSATNKALTWTSADPSIATVDSEGNVTGVSAGKTKVRVTTCNGLYRETDVVVSVLLDSITLDRSDMNMKVGDSQTLSYSLHPSNASSTGVNWYSSDYSIAYVSGGTVVARKPGTAVITVEGSNSIKATCTVTVTGEGGGSSQPSSPVTPSTPADASKQYMYRLYNPNSGEHFFTANTEERDNLASIGWSYEGVAWTAPKTSNTPVYRLYNGNGGEHHYTTSMEEANVLTGIGWSLEGIGWYSDDAQEVPLYRMYNPNAYANNHHYTTSGEERDNLTSIGWSYEGIGWYGCN